MIILIQEELLQATLIWVGGRRAQQLITIGQSPPIVLAENIISFIALPKVAATGFENRCVYKGKRTRVGPLMNDT